MKYTVRKTIILNGNWLEKISTILRVEEIPVNAQISVNYNAIINETEIIAIYEKDTAH